MAKAMDLSGQTFNQLTVVRRAHNSRENNTQFWCLCSCGNGVLVRGRFITTGHTKSCGCHKSQLTAERNISNSTHGHCRGGINSQLYQVWANMIDRCTRPEHPGFENYGGRGIKVCDRWLHSFENFIADMGPRPEGMTLDRWPDKNGNYEPSNCRWATWKQQANNRRVTEKVIAHLKRLHEGNRKHAL